MGEEGTTVKCVVLYHMSEQPHCDGDNVVGNSRNVVHDLCSCVICKMCCATSKSLVHNLQLP